MFTSVVALMADLFGLDADEVTAETTFESLDLDSLDLVEFAQAAQDEYDLEITDEEAEGLKTVGQAVTLLETKQSEAGTA